MEEYSGKISHEHRGSDAKYYVNSDVLTLGEETKPVTTGKESMMEKYQHEAATESRPKNIFTVRNTKSSNDSASEDVANQHLVVSVPMSYVNHRVGPMVMVPMDAAQYNEFVLARARRQAITFSIIALIFGIPFLAIPALILALRPINHPALDLNYRNSKIISLASISMWVIAVALLMMFLVPHGTWNPFRHGLAPPTPTHQNG